MRGLKTILAGAGVAAVAAIASTNAANALASYSSTVGIDVVAASANYAKGWSPVKPFSGTSTSTYAQSGQFSGGTETVLQDFGTTTHSYVGVNSFSKLYENTVPRTLIDASKTLSGSADSVGGEVSGVETTNGVAASPWRTGFYFYNKNSAAADIEFTTEVTLDLLTTIDDSLSESAMASGSVYATLQIFTSSGVSTTVPLSQFDLSGSVTGGDTDSLSTGSQLLTFTLPAKVTSFSPYAIVNFYATMGGAASSVPVPAALPMLGFALGGLGLMARRRAKKTNA